MHIKFSCSSPSCVLSIGVQKAHESQFNSLSFYFFILFCCLPYQNTCRLHGLTIFGSQSPLSRNCVHTVHHPPCIGKFWNHLVNSCDPYTISTSNILRHHLPFLIKKCWDRKEETFSLVLFLKKLDYLNLDKFSKRQPPSNEKVDKTWNPFWQLT